MADHDRTTTDGLGGMAGLKYDMGGADRLVAPCDPSSVVPCYPAMTYDAGADCLAGPEHLPHFEGAAPPLSSVAPPPEPDSDDPVVVPVRRG